MLIIQNKWMWKNTKIVYILTLETLTIFYGILMVDFILDNGNCILQEKDRNQVKGFNLCHKNSYIKESSKKEKEMGLGLWNC